MAKKKKAALPPPPPKRHVEKNGEGVRSAPAGFAMPDEEFRPPKIVVVGVEGWGKTSLGAHINGASILMPETEQGYKTLVGAKRVPLMPCLVTTTWKQTLEAIDKFNGDTLVLDELSGFEKQCHEYVCNNEYKGDWAKFWAYHRGVKIALPEWLKFLAKLERKGIMVVALSHCSIETFKDPMNDDHDRYVAALFRDTWGVTRRWADACLFGTFVSIVDDDKGKGIGGEERILYTEHRDTHDAKNRYGMNPEIDIPDEVEEVWPVIWSAINGEDEDED